MFRAIVSASILAPCMVIFWSTVEHCAKPPRKTRKNNAMESSGDLEVLEVRTGVHIMMYVRTGSVTHTSRLQAHTQRRVSVSAPRVFFNIFRASSVSFLFCLEVRISYRVLLSYRTTFVNNNNTDTVFLIG